MAKCPRSKRRARKGNRWTGKRKLEKGREGRTKRRKAAPPPPQPFSIFLPSRPFSGCFLTCTGNDSHPVKTPGMYRAGQAGVEQNDRADRMAGEVRLGRSEVLRSLRHYLQAQSRGHRTIDRLEDRGVVTESARRPSLKDQKEPQSIRPTLKPFQRQSWGTSERRGGTHNYGLSKCTDAILN